MNIQRIARQFAASATSQVIILGQQLLLPPIFIHKYGVALYGEWLALSAAVAYLATLRFGVQTYVNNELTMRYARQEMAEYQVMQSTALRMLLGAALAAAAALSLVFFLPVNEWLHLSLSQPVVATAIFFLGLQVLANLPVSYFCGTFMVFGMAHRGTTWQNIARILMVAVAAIMAWFHASFAAIAIGQFILIVVHAGMVLIDLKRLEPSIFPNLRHWHNATARAILGPSWYFFLIYSCNFLVYQLPVLLIQWTLGPIVVVAFTIMRTIFSMMRQALSVATNSVGPEVTNLFGRRESASLANLYALSEKVVFAAIPPLNITALLLAPVILQVWLHKPALYSLTTYALMALASCAISVKDHKVIFQISTNDHRNMAVVQFLSYVVMIALSLFALPRFGLPGFLVLWFLTEVGQAAWVLRLNAQLLATCGPASARATVTVSHAPALRMAIFLPCALAAACLVEQHVHTASWTTQAAAALSFGILLAGLSGWIFDLRHVVHRLAQLRKVA